MAHSSAPAAPKFTPWAGDDGPPLSPLASNPVIFRRHSTELNDTRVPRAPMARSNTPSRALADDSDFRRISFGSGLDDDELELGKNIQARRGREDFTSLVDFLKNHEPPPDNYMSVPYGSSAAAAAAVAAAAQMKHKGKWSKFKRVGKKRSISFPRPRSPKPLRLPDSAVSGTTIGGHRHIAISIPLEAMPFADAAKSQYPVFPNGRLEPKVPRDEPPAVQTFTDENGVVTVLRAAGGTTISSAPRPHHPPRPLLLAHLDQKAYSPANNNKSHQKSGSHSTDGSYKGRDYVGILPNRTDTPHAEEAKAASQNIPQKERPKQPSARDFQRSVYPTRGSSMTANRGYTHPMSIDGIISLYPDTKSTPAGAHGYDTKPLPKAPTNRERINASRPSTRQPSPISEKSHEAVENKGPKLRLISDPPVVAAKEISRPSSRGSIASRRDKVRDRKRRDMEALRKAKDPGQQSEDERPGIQKEESQTAVLKQRPSQPMLCPIQVVVDLEPVPEYPEELQTISPQPLLSGTPKRQLSTVSSVGRTNHPTPPTSFSGSPLQKHGSRSSRKVHHEWDANEEEAETKKRDAPRPRAHHPHQQPGRESQTDKQILRLYDSYRENRMRDVERRIRRLERNGDIWLRALIPVLDDMSRTMKAAHPEVVRDVGDYASDDEEEVAGTPERKPRGAERKRVVRRSSTSRERIMAGLAQKGEESDWSESMSRSDDISGMGSIEPLMRELAGEARRRQRQVAAQTLDDGYYNAM
ncbi:hypothetical protein PT974_01181 [Cladobotryum mycophilum]|uniref:Uncharacterized protein n=1 Tax=Cladobotryum mycophilum TaxID=491253 RepID=A0ABR0T2X8_9HYPO